jgi:hypothetical protein
VKRNNKKGLKMFNLSLTCLVLLGLVSRFSNVHSMGAPKILPPTTKSEGIRVRIQNGDIKGFTDISRNGREFHGFAAESRR